MFASAGDYDATGILAGVDPCESRYWWMPELHATASSLARQAETTPAAEPAMAERRPGLLERLLSGRQAASRSGSRTTAAA
jgi:hypothetical protein